MWRPKNTLRAIFCRAKNEQDSLQRELQGAEEFEHQYLATKGRPAPQLCSLSQDHEPQHGQPHGRLSGDSHPELSQSGRTYGTLATYTSDHLSKWQKARFEVAGL